LACLSPENVLKDDSLKLCTITLHERKLSDALGGTSNQFQALITEFSGVALIPEPIPLK
jgi:hypothetical protein